MNLKYLRRYARALLGSQQSGDTYVRLCLETLLQQRDVLLTTGDVRQQLFKLFHEVWQRVNVDDDTDGVVDLAVTDFSIKNRLEAIPTSERQVLLLTTLEGFSVQQAGEILGIPTSHAENLLAKAWVAVSEQISTTVLVIEDEALIAEDIINVVKEMGHKVVGSTDDQAEAIEIARRENPGLVLADINLGRGGSGLVAAQEILQSMDVPVIFITAYPEQLLTGERMEPTYLVTKPFQHDTLRATISQALSLKKIEDSQSKAPSRSASIGR